MITVITQTGSVFKFRTGQPKTQITGRVVSLEIDGEELEAVKKEFVNIPYARSKTTMVFHGEWARFLWDNF